MSVYSSSTTWGGNCSNPNQSPVNLSQSTSKPCDLLCDLVFDDAFIPQANVMISDEGLVLNSTSGLGSCKFNGEGYTCNTLLLSHPSHHTIETIQADAEVIAIFTNPTGKFLCVSSLIRVNPHQTPSTHFFNAFIPYGNPSADYTPVNLGDNWGLFMMVPPSGSYFVYDGSLVTPPCQTTTWVVFKSMINIDSNDFALLVKNVNPGSRPLQELGNREVFFNDTEQLVGGPMPHDNKTYMKCRRAGKPTTKPVTSVPLGDKHNEKKPSHLKNASDWVSKQIEINGFMELLSAALMIVSFLVGIRFGWDVSKEDFNLKPMIWGQYIGEKIRWVFMWLYDSIMSFANKPKPIAVTSAT
jgi:carbonic anhydrase